VEDCGDGEKGDAARSEKGGGRREAKKGWEGVGAVGPLVGVWE